MLNKYYLYLKTDVKYMLIMNLDREKGNSMGQFPGVLGRMNTAERVEFFKAFADDKDNFASLPAKTSADYRNAEINMLKGITGRLAGTDAELKTVQECNSMLLCLRTMLKVYQLWSMDDLVDGVKAALLSDRKARGDHELMKVKRFIDYCQGGYSDAGKRESIREGLSQDEAAVMEQERLLRFAKRILRDAAYSKGE